MGRADSNSGDRNSRRRARPRADRNSARSNLLPARRPAWTAATDGARCSSCAGACEAGDTRACVQFGIIIGENRERRAQWRRESPELFWWER